MMKIEDFADALPVSTSPEAAQNGRLTTAEVVNTLTMLHGRIGRCNELLEQIPTAQPGEVARILTDIRDTATAAAKAADKLIAANR
jgi:hypothetical protein